MRMEGLISAVYVFELTGWGGGRSSPVPVSAGSVSTNSPNWPWQLLSGGKKDTTALPDTEGQTKHKLERVT